MTATDTKRIQGLCPVCSWKAASLEAEIERLRDENQKAWNECEFMDEKRRHAEAALRKAVAAEREACAQVAEEVGIGVEARAIAAAIRGRKDE